MLQNINNWAILYYEHTDNLGVETMKLETKLRPRIAEAPYNLVSKVLRNIDGLV